MALTPTAEQTEIRRMFAVSRENMAIQAGAGTGKTSTLIMLGEDAQTAGRRAIYTAFNKSIVEEAKTKFTGNVECRTVHSLAYRDTMSPSSVERRDDDTLDTLNRRIADRKAHAKRLNAPRMKPWDVARILGLDPFVVTYGTQSKRLGPDFLQGLVMRGISSFCQTADPEPTERHIPYQDGIDVPAADGGRTYSNNNELRRYLAPFLAVAWADLTSPHGRLRFSFDHYLKMWQLSSPTIDSDLIFFDEAQDANPVMLDVISKQTHAQVIFVGDSCQPPGTMVQVVVGKGGTRGKPTVIEERPIETLAAGDTVVTYDVAGAHLHRRGRQVTGISSRPFHGDLVSVKCGEHSSRYTPDHRCVVKIADAFHGKHLVYVMRRGQQYRVGRAMGRYDTQRGAFGPMLRAIAEHADALWILGAYDDVETASEVEMRAAWFHGVPTLTFRYHGRHTGGLSAEGLDRFWEMVGDNTVQATSLLTAYGRDARHPLWEAGAGNLLIRRTIVTRASNLMHGMRMLPSDEETRSYGREMGIQFWAPILVSREHYVGPVYSMDVADHQTYVADGLVTHNCQQIYEFTGAVNAMGQLPADRTAYLTQSFRFGDDVAAVANGLLGRLVATLRLVGHPPIPSVVGPVTAPAAILCRTNGRAVGIMMEQVAAGRKPFLMGGSADVLGFARGARDLQNGKHTNHRELACFTSWDQVVEYVDNDQQGIELRMLVNLIETHGADAVIDCLSNMGPECDADVILSTAHKAKGREWGTVKLADDFRPPKGGGELTPSELRLLYVAVTRSQYELDIEDTPHVLTVPPLTDTGGQLR